MTDGFDIIASLQTRLSEALVKIEAREAEIERLKADNAILSKWHLEAEEEAQRLWKEVKRLNAIWEPKLEEWL